MPESKPSEYAQVQAEIASLPPDAQVNYLMTRLSGYWAAAYRATTDHPTDLHTVSYGSFHYLFDCFPMFSEDFKADNEHPIEPRMVAAYGVSNPNEGARDDYRLRGWVGATETYFGKEWDKGHFIAHSIGGAVDLVELNVFLHLRSLNRGWSDQGKRFRSMERACSRRAGTFCFHRPLYDDASNRPARLEFGLLREDGTFWIDLFDNL
ncbi:MAG: hypothetical protein R2834_20430 [Rhodothermales bacterium]